MNVLVLGADIIAALKKNSWKPYNLEELLQVFREHKKNISLEQFYDTLLFLWLADIIELHDSFVSIKENASTQIVF